jgi:hypothetical protein
MTSMLAKVLSELGYHGTEGQRTKWVIEREVLIGKLRELCTEFGDNDWEPDLNLGDVLDNHLGRYLEEPSDPPTADDIIAMFGELDYDEKRKVLDAIESSWTDVGR